MLILLALAVNAVKKNTEVQKLQIASFGFFLCELRASVFHFHND